MSTTREVALSAGSAAGLLTQLRAHREARETAERALLTDAVAWAVMHPVESIDQAATYVLRHAGDTGIPVAGDGAPLVAEFSVAEFAAALGVSTESGKNALGEALELRYRLPRLWAGAMSGEIPVWRARLVARDTQHLDASAAAFVDAQAAAVGARVSPGQLRRLVEEAIGRYMPEEAQEILDASWDSRHVSFDHDQITFVGNHANGSGARAR